MDLATILLISGLVLESAIGAGLVLVWRQGRRRPGAEGDASMAIRREMGRLERYLDGKVDLLLVELRGRPEVPPVEPKKDDGETLGRISPPREPAVPDEHRAPPDLRTRPPSRGRNLSDAEELELLLNSPDFRTGVWPRMDGPFDVASAHLLGFLAARGGYEPRVSAHPELAPGYENHWDFMVLASNDGDDGPVRFLIPRHFSRYDPAVHDHLFRVMGGGESLEYFIHELRQCAVLRGSGPLDEFIEPRLVDRKGVVVV